MGEVIVARPGRPLRPLRGLDVGRVREARRHLRHGRLRRAQEGLRPAARVHGERRPRAPHQLDEIQSVVRAAEEDTQRPKAPKKNPLKNLEAMLALNPYQQVVRDNEMKAQKSKKPKYAKQDKARRAASQAFYNQARVEGEVTL